MLVVLETFLSVRCRHCEKFIRVSGSVAKRASHDTSNTEDWQLSSQVFVLRCRSCEKESVYSMNQVVAAPVIPPEDAHAQ
jgi:phage FluMu protein Com